MVLSELIYWRGLGLYNKKRPNVSFLSTTMILNIMADVHWLFQSSSKTNDEQLCASYVCLVWCFHALQKSS